MAKLPRSLIALPVRWTGGALNVTVTDDVGAGRTVAVIPSGTLWTRTFLAPNSGGTSEDAPRDLIRYVEAQLNAGGGSWAVELRDTGLVRVTYGGTGTGSITWGAASSVRNALGFSGNISLASGANVNADSHPAFCWLPYSLSQDTGWRSSPSHLVAARRADGLVTAWDEGVQSVERTLRADYAPTNESLRLSRSLYATPYWPPDNEPTRWTAPSIVPESCPAAWTVHETLSCAPGLRAAYVIGNLQDLVAATEDRYYVGAFDPEPLQSAEQRAVLSVGNYSSLVSVPTVRLTQAKLSTQETR